MSILAIIPSRYASTRFPGKPLVDILGKTMIRRVYEQASKVFEDVVVATDDQRIQDEVKSFGGNVVMTSQDHKSGTDRCWEALQKYENQTGSKFKYVINIQGDEPFVNPKQLELLEQTIYIKDSDIATLIKKFDRDEDIFDVNKVKVIYNKNNSAIYFSRWPIPYVRDNEKKNWQNTRDYYLHIGLYAYRRDVLEKITELKPSPLELSESLEQLRWLENGYTIKVAETIYKSIGIDTPEDLVRLKLKDVQED
jgi:3-deoxy-manno-octulosonate cytidylyltransferase (CMP-KDO synthetase)